jgi:hypothetical protein
MKWQIFISINTTSQTLQAVLKQRHRRSIAPRLRCISNFVVMVSISYTRTIKFMIITQWSLMCTVFSHLALPDDIDDERVLSWPPFIHDCALDGC